MSQKSRYSLRPTRARAASATAAATNSSDFDAAMIETMTEESAPSTSTRRRLRPRAGARHNPRPRVFSGPAASGGVISGRVERPLRRRIVQTSSSTPSSSGAETQEPRPSGAAEERLRLLAEERRRLLLEAEDLRARALLQHQRLQRQREWNQLLRETLRAMARPEDAPVSASATPAPSAGETPSVGSTTVNVNESDNDDNDDDSDTPPDITGESIAVSPTEPAPTPRPPTPTVTPFQSRFCPHRRLHRMTTRSQSDAADSADSADAAAAQTALLTTPPSNHASSTTRSRTRSTFVAANVARNLALGGLEFPESSSVGRFPEQLSAPRRLRATTSGADDSDRFPDDFYWDLQDEFPNMRIFDGVRSTRQDQPQRQGETREETDSDSDSSDSDTDVVIDDDDDDDDVSILPSVFFGSPVSDFLRAVIPSQRLQSYGINVVRFPEPLIAKLTPEEIKSLPLSRIGDANEKFTCTICFVETKMASVIRVLPDCDHRFHKNCIDKWLVTNATCPLCRNRVRPPGAAAAAPAAAPADAPPAAGE